MSTAPQLAPSDQKLILVVDDVPANLGVISGTLKDSYKTKIATNGEKALALASTEVKQLLIATWGTAASVMAGPEKVTGDSLCGRA